MWNVKRSWSCKFGQTQLAHLQRIGSHLPNICFAFTFPLWIYKYLPALFFILQYYNFHIIILYNLSAYLWKTIFDLRWIFFPNASFQLGNTILGNFELFLEPWLTWGPKMLSVFEKANQSSFTRRRCILCNILKNQSRNI